MKKEYKKPELLFDSFELSTSIAVGCGIITKLPSEGSCGYNDNGQIIFTSSLTGCEYEGNDKICYDVPFDSNKLFSS